MSAAPFQIAPLGRYAAALTPADADFDAAECAASAVVFAPHPDDETLGCGGTIVRKRMAGADVRLVFVTDGSRSHAALMPPAELARLRREEALEAAAALGVPAGNVTFLDYPDGALAAHARDAQARIAGLLRAARPAQVFVPYRGEAPADHHVTNRLVRAALRQEGLAATVYEYPVWTWYHWPRLGLPLRPGRAAFDLVRNSLRARLGLRVLRDFTAACYVGDVLDRKRAALDRHRSQMTRLLPDPAWLTLGDVAGGAFLDCFFGSHEVFHRYRQPRP